MRAFEVFLNDERLCCAGFEGDGVLNVILNNVERDGNRDEYLEVGGLVSAIGEFVDWIHQPLRTGDEVRIKVLESSSVDEPKERRRRNAGQEAELQKHYVREMAKKLGWTLTEGG